MFDRLAQLDTAWFRWINREHANGFFDALMPFVTGDANWHIPILVAWTALVLFGGGRGRTAALLVVPLLTLSDQLSSNLLKDAFDRVRPCIALADVRCLVGCGSSPAMPSSHAANFSAAAIHLGMFYPRVAPLLLAIALLVSYSRVYVGVHYPLDTVVGLVVGLVSAVLIQGAYHLGRRFAARWRGRAVGPGTGAATSAP